MHLLLRLLLASSMLAAMVPASTIRAAAEDAPVLCVPESLVPPATGAQGNAAAQAQDGLPYRLVLPLVARAVEDPPPPPPPPPGPPPEFLALQERLAGIVARSPVSGRFAIAVTDLQTGHTVGVSEDRIQLSGCVMNLFAIVAALRDVDADRYPLSAVDATIRQTIWASDATAARSLFRTVGDGDAVEGVRRVRALLHGPLGMASSDVDHPPAFPGESIGVGPNNLVTARDVNEALARIYAGEVLSPELTAYLLEAMTHVKPGLNYLTGTVPSPGLVSHKNGFFWDPEGWVDNDTAIVRFGPDYQYGFAITFLSEAVPGLYDDIPTGQALVREAWAYFASAYQ